MAGEFYVLKSDDPAARAHGPFDSTQLRQLASQGKLKPEHFVRQGEPGGKIVRASQIKGLFAAQPVATPPAPALVERAPAPLVDAWPAPVPVAAPPTFVVVERAPVAPLQRGVEAERTLLDLKPAYFRSQPIQILIYKPLDVHLPQDGVTAVYPVLAFGGHYRARFRQRQPPDSGR